MTRRSIALLAPVLLSLLALCLVLAPLSLADEEPDGKLDAKLLRAARRGRVADVRALLAEGASVRARDAEGRTALELARERGHEELVAFLEPVVDRDTFDRAKGFRRIRSLEYYLAEFPGGAHREEARALIRAIAYEKAVAKGTRTALEIYLRKYPRSEFESQVRARLEELSFASAEEEGELASYERFLATYPGGRRAAEAALRLEALWLERAREGGRSVDFAAFAERFPDGYHTTEALVTASKLMKSELDEGLAELRGVDFDPEARGAWGELPIHRAVLEGDLPILRALLHEGADVDTVLPRTGLRALHLAAIHGRPGFARLLIEAGATLTARDDLGHSALDFAERGSPVAEMLIARGVMRGKAGTLELPPPPIPLTDALELVGLERAGATGLRGRRAHSMRLRDPASGVEFVFDPYEGAWRPAAERDPFTP